jgi:hypothetical protein
MPEARSGHVILGVNVLVLGYLPAARQWDPRLTARSPLDGKYWQRIGLRTHPADDQVAGVILRPARDEPALRELVDDIVPELVAVDVIHAATGSGTHQ